MKSPSPSKTARLNIENMYPAAATTTLLEAPQRPLETAKIKSKENLTSSNLQEISVPELLKMVTEPLNEYCKDSNAPKLGISRSQDDDYNEELVEQNFGSISPIFQKNRLHVSPLGTARATNFRLRFRKSHTCGSLFANCNCSSPTTTTTIIPMPMPSPLPLPLPTPVHASAGAKRASMERAPSAAKLSISPSHTEHSMSSLSSSSAKLNTNTTTSGIYSLSTQTSATSGQLSRDDSMNVSFDSVDFENSIQVGKQVVGSGRILNTQKAKSLNIPRISSTTSDNTTTLGRSIERKTQRLFQSYSHPDTDFIFTDENKHPSKESLVQVHHHHHHHQPEAVIKTRDGKIEIKHLKRSSSPNIGHYQILDVAVHPDILVKISPKHSPISEARKLTNSPLSGRSAQQRRRLLQRSHEIESGGSTSESEYTVESKSPTNNYVPSPIRHQSPTELIKPKALAVNKTDDTNFQAAQKFFAESGILGPINTTSNLIRKTSKILQDANVIEQIRKTSMILRGVNSNNGNGNKSPISSASQPTTPSTPPNGTITVTPATPVHANLALNLQQHHDNMETSVPIIYTATPTKNPHTIAANYFSPNMSSTQHIIDDKDAQIKSLQGEIVSLHDVIKSRDAEIMKLRREIHKLKSVLQQTATNPLPLAKDELLQSSTARLSPLQCITVTSTEQKQQQQQQQQQQQICNCCKKQCLTNQNEARLSPISNGSSSSSSSAASTSSTESTASDNFQSCNSLATSNVGITAVTCALSVQDQPNSNNKIIGDMALDGTCTAASDILPLPYQTNVNNKLYQMAHAPVLKKQGVSGESCEQSKQQSFTIPIPQYDKDFSSKQLIKDAIMDNDFLKNIDASQVRELVESMYPLTVAKGEFVIREGEAGAHLYVSAEGEFEVVKNGKVLGIMGPGKAFGELAILYNCTRTASIRVLCDARVWVLDRRVFQQIMMRTGMQRIENSVNFLKSVPLLKNLSDELLAKIADVLEVEFYPAGTYIIRQGASGDTFFLISQGSVQVTQKFSYPTSEEKEIRTLKRGDYFGEQALINEDKRTANIIALAPGVECLTLDRESFKHLIGDLCELKEKNYGDENRVLAMKFADKTKQIFGANVKQEFPHMKLTDLEVVGTLGIGGFGRVELVKAYQENRVDVFALKCLKKRHIVDTKQEEHVFSERTIMLSCNTPFICRLYRTFRDEKYVYMLLEACMGGEIWTMLRDRGCFTESATQFIIGCVLQAFEYLHARGIIYRDLKPENLMLDERGYVKLVDFGFAKYIGNSSKTWTFCGTPEYVAPEIILNKGHDRAVDYWALGVLIHELLNGTPPFTANDPMKTYNIILKGIDMITFPKHMTRSAVQLIKRLCRDVPAERLGYQKGGIQDIKKHKWFLGFDWDGLESQLLIPPFIRPISHPTDTCYFDKFPGDLNEPVDENSGWDIDF